MRIYNKALCYTIVKQDRNPFRAILRVRGQEVMSDINYDGDFLGISEFAKIVDITAETLRHYDNTGVFRAAKRTKHNGYRLYSAMQITIVKMVRIMAGIEVPLETIKMLAMERTPEQLLKLLSRYSGKIDNKIKTLQEARLAVSIYIDLLSEGLRATEDDITVTNMEEKGIILGGFNDYSGVTEFYREFIRFCTEQHEPIVNLSFPVGGFFDDMDTFIGNPSKPTRFFSLDSRGYEKKAAGLYMVGYTRGYYGKTGDLPARMLADANERGLAFCGLVYCFYLHDELSEDDPDDYLLQVSVPVKETRNITTRAQGLSKQR